MNIYPLPYQNVHTQMLFVYKSPLTKSLYPQVHQHKMYTALLSTVPLLPSKIPTLTSDTIDLSQAFFTTNYVIKRIYSQPN